MTKMNPFETNLAPTQCLPSNHVENLSKQGNLRKMENEIEWEQKDSTKMKCSVEGNYKKNICATQPNSLFV